MAPKHALVLWAKSKKVSTVLEGSFVQSFDENGKEIPISEGTVRTVSIGQKLLEAKILRICSSKKYLESLVVTKEGEILLYGSEPPPLELLAKKSTLQNDDDTEDQKPAKNVSTTLHRTTAEEQSHNRLTLEEAAKCNHGCASCCSGTLPPFPKLPDGFISALTSLAEYFQEFQKATANTVVPEVKQPSMGKNLNTWQWASREKIELKKGTGVWVDSIKLEKIIGQAEITKKPPHQTLVKSLLTHLLGIDKYIETSAEKIDRRLLSAVVGYTNEKYSDLAQPIERYYRCINLNRGYMLKRKNEGAFFNNHMASEYDGTVRTRRTDARKSRRHSAGDTNNLVSETRPKRGRKPGFKRDAQQSVSNKTLSNFNSSDQLMIPLECEEGEDIPIVSGNDLSQIIVMHSDSSIPIPNSESVIHSSGNVSVPDCEVLFANVSQRESNIKVEQDYDYIEGALDITL